MVFQPNSKVPPCSFHHYFINTADHQYYAEQSNAETERDRNIWCPTGTSVEHLPKAGRSVPVSIKFGSVILAKITAYTYNV